MQHDTVMPPQPTLEPAPGRLALARARSYLVDLASADDAIRRYKARTLVLGESASLPELAALRSRISSTPIARALLGHRQSDGTIAAAPYRKWQGPHWTLTCLALIDYPPRDRDLRPILEQVYAWLFSGRHLRPPGTAIYEGQEDRVRRCASQEGNAIWYAVRLGLADERTRELVDRLVAWQWPDGGWNCDKRLEARSSSVQETAIPLRGLWAYGTAFDYRPALAAATRGAELLLSHRLLWRRRDGEMIRPDWGGPVDQIHFPIQFYDVLFALQVMAELGRIGDPRCADALRLLVSKQLPDGGFPLEERIATTAKAIKSRGTWADWGPGGLRTANPLVTVDALGVLAAASGPGRSDSADPVSSSSMASAG